MPTDQNNPLNMGVSDIKQPAMGTDELKSQPALSFGKQLVGLNFNPSNDTGVDKAKRLCAELADLVFDEFNNGNEVTMLKSELYHHTIGEILNAQMNVVKLLTLKY